MFKECRKCEEGMECKDDYASLKSGYWWKWRNETYKDRYRYFVKNLLTAQPALGNEDVQHSYPIPTPYMCPTEDSCQGGIDSRCRIGYKGPLCSVCISGYYKQLQTCNQCPSKTWIAGQLSIIAVIALIIIAVSVWTTKRIGHCTTHIYGYLKEWRKNPQWSFSCCLALILPLLDLQGDISGLAQTNLLNTQLDTGRTGITSITDAVKSSGAIDVTLREKEEGDNPVEAVDGWNGNPRNNNKNCFKETQTVLSLSFSNSDAAIDGSEVETHF